MKIVSHEVRRCHGKRLPLSHSCHAGLHEFFLICTAAHAVLMGELINHVEQRLRRLSKARDRDFDSAHIHNTLLVSTLQHGSGGAFDRPGPLLDQISHANHSIN